MGKNDLELLEIYMDMVEKQDEIIYRMTALLKSYVREIHNLRTINGFFEVDSNQEIDEKIWKNVWTVRRNGKNESRKALFSLERRQ